MAEIHDRMPVVLDEADWPKWLGEEPATLDELYALLKPCPDEALKAWPVDKSCRLGLQIHEANFEHYMQEVLAFAAGTSGDGTRQN